MTAEVAFSLPAPANARLVVFDIAGRRVREIASASFGAGEHRARWDGNDGAGRPAAAGSYFVRLETGDGAALVERVLLLR